MSNKSSHIYSRDLPCQLNGVFYGDDKVFFATSREAANWTKYPKKGDLIVTENSGDFDLVREKVFINGELVFQRTNQTDALVKHQNDLFVNSMIKEFKRQ